MIFSRVKNLESEVRSLKHDIQIVEQNFYRVRKSLGDLEERHQILLDHLGLVEVDQIAKIILKKKDA